MKTFRQPVREFVSLEPGNPPPTPPFVEDARGHRYLVRDGRLMIESAAGRGPARAAPDPFPVAGVACATVSPDGDLWFGTPQGVVRWSGGRFEIYAGPRWLPDDRVEALACADDGSILVRTAKGGSRIRFLPMTLEEKAAHYERLTDTRHRRFGFVIECNLPSPGDLDGWRHGIGDNDGLWTAMYVAAESYRWAVTGDETARERARESLHALLALEERSPVPGFPARALTHRSEERFGNHPDGEWHRTDDGEWEWKGDTSSDEIVGHYYAWGIYFDLVADEDDRARIRETVRRVTDHILDHGLHLVDLDGRPTRWGVWAPEELNDSPRWRSERGLNSLEILSHLKVAVHITGEARYAAAAAELIRDHGYALNTVEQKILPGDFPGAEDNHSDDELAFLSYEPLLRYEKDPQLRAIYLASLERSWRIERPERCPLWNFIYGAATGRACDADLAVESLREIPLDLVDWPTRNLHRLDIRRNPRDGRAGEPQLLEPLSWRERPLHKWNGNPYRAEGGSGRNEECGTFWLLPYWMGRYHGLLEG